MKLKPFSPAACPFPDIPEIAVAVGYTLIVQRTAKRFVTPLVSGASKGSVVISVAIIITVVVVIILAAVGGDGPGSLREDSRSK